MKLRIASILMIFILLLAGCGSKAENTNHPACKVVEDYLKQSCANNWDKVESLLSGQALYEARKNKERINTTETILSKNIVVTWATDRLAEVYADVTKETYYGDDRVAYKFNLVKIDDDWKIYKTNLSDFIRPELKDGELNPEVEKTIKDYFALTTSEKKEQDTKYLAGRLLRVSLASKQVQGSKQNTPEAKQKVISITPLGITEDYVVVETLFEGDDTAAWAVIDLVKVNNAWKIVQLDIVK